MSRPKSTVEWVSKADDMPPGMYDVARNRMEPFVSFYGNFIRSVTLDQLAISAYLQGCRDMGRVAVNEVIALGTPIEPLDFQI